ncbi:MAG: response regulator [Burkholderiales bacterium]|nr:response regulator [Burkholderiales bacterium]
MVNSKDREEVCSTREASKMLGVSLRTIQLWVESGSLKAWKTPGGHRRVSRKSVEGLLAARRFEGIPARENLIEVLVVEDDLALCRLYEATIGRWNIPVRIRTVIDGFDALVAIGAEKPDIMIIDINLPAMDGVALLRKLRQNRDYDDLEILVVTDLDAEEIEKRGGVPKGIPVFLKPAPFGLIQASMQEIASRKLEGCLVRN